MSILVAITNFGHSTNADRLKKQFSKEFPTLLIDASSPQSPLLVDTIIPNSYYPGLWNAAVQSALEKNYDWLLFLASDVQVENPKVLSRLIREVVQDSAVGVYSPSLSAKSRAAFKTTYKLKTNLIRRCGLIEGFAFLARTEILKNVYPIPPSNRFGWLVDIITCEIARSKGFQVVVDDRTTITHPKSNSPIDEGIAMEDGFKFAESLGLSRQIIENSYAASQQVTYNFHHANLSMQRSLDLGCGANPQNPYSAENLYGIDISLPSTHTEHEIRVADLVLEPIPWPDNYFDVITAFDFIEHIPRLVFTPDRRQPFINLMNEIWRCLKPNGIFHSLTPAYPAKEAFQDPTHVNIITEDTFKQYFSGPNWGEMYGFQGRFHMESQEWVDKIKLLTIMKKSNLP